MANNPVNLDKCPFCDYEFDKSEARFRHIQTHSVEVLNHLRRERV